MYKTSFKITKENILSRISQEEIFEKILGITVELKTKIKNPLREDNFPSCYFYYNKNQLRFRDPALPLNEDCFGLVMKINNCNFMEALEYIAFIFELTQENKIVKSEFSLYKEKSKVIDIIFTPVFNTNKEGEIIWRKEELEYWKQYYITPEVLKEFKVFSIRGYYKDNILRYIYKSSDICFCYGQRENAIKKYKFYYPNRSIIRFISNMKEIDGYNDLPEKGKLLVITKSRKDRMCLSLFGIISIAVQAEGNYIIPDILDDIEKRFERIIIFFDFDRTGVTGTNRLKRKRGYEYIFLTNGRFYSDDYKAKDFSEFLKLNGIEKTQHLIEYAKQELLL